MGAGGPDEPSPDPWVGCYADVYALADDDERTHAVEVVGRPTEIAVRGKLAALPEFARWGDSLTSAVAAAGDLSQVSAALDQWASEHAEDERLAARIYEPAMQARMAGELFVRAIEVPESVPSASRVQLDDPPPTVAFARLPFEEALDSFLSRRLVTPAEWLQLSDEGRAQAFAATRMAAQQLAARAKALLERALADGMTLSEFQRTLEAEAGVLGVTAPSSWYAENVMRTNVQQAYGTGRLTQMSRVQRMRPLIEYRTAGDNRVRPRHQELDGIVFDQVQDPGWTRFAPPLGYQCRCTIVTVRPSRMDSARGRVVSSDALAGRGLGADRGFAGPGVGF